MIFSSHSDTNQRTLLIYKTQLIQVLIQTGVYKLHNSYILLAGF